MTRLPSLCIYIYIIYIYIYTMREFQNNKGDSSLFHRIDDVELHFFFRV